MCGGDKPYIAPADLERCHEEFRECSVRHFRSVKKMGGDEFCQRYQSQLEAELDEAYANFTKHNDGKNIFYAARTPATLFAVMFAAYVVSGVTGFVGLSTLAALANLLMGVALLSLCAWAYVKYSGEFREVGVLIDLVAENLWEQVGPPRGGRFRGVPPCSRPGVHREEVSTGRTVCVCVLFDVCAREHTSVRCTRLGGGCPSFFPLLF